MTESELLKALNIKKCGVNSCENISMPFNTPPYICRKCWDICFKSLKLNPKVPQLVIEIEEWIKLQND